MSIIPCFWTSNATFKKGTKYLMHITVINFILLQQVKPKASSTTKKSQHGSDKSKTKTEIFTDERESTKIASNTKHMTATSTTKLKKQAEKSLSTRTKTTTHSITSTRTTVSSVKSQNQLIRKPSVISSTAFTSQTSTKNRKPPATPPSTRVSKSQFFPSKNVYSNALEQAKLEMDSKPQLIKIDSKIKESKGAKESAKTKQKSINNEQKSTTPKTSSEKIRSKETTKHRPKIVAGHKLLTTQTSSEKYTVHRKSIDPEATLENTHSLASISRPGTATLRQPTIINEIVNKAESENQPSESEDPDYEDDFDSYESDFEEYVSSSTSDVLEVSGRTGITSSSSDENLHSATSEKMSKSAGMDTERKLDSGTFDLTEYKNIHVLDNIKESVEKESTFVTANNMASLSDEGFEDVKSSDTEKMHFVNFTDAQKQYSDIKNTARRNKRGEDILRMIKFDTYGFTLFDFPPIPYEKFIKLYGKRSGVQVSSQTGDDNIEQETQTEEVFTENKWTQLPITFSKYDVSNSNYIDVYKSEFIGIGSDTNPIKTKSNDKQIGSRQFEKFMFSAGQLMINLLEESNVQISKELQNSNVESFSSGYIEFNSGFSSHTKECSVVYISYKDDGSKMITVHNKAKQESECKGFKSIMYLWRISNPNKPEKVFAAYSEITCCTFETNDGRIIFGGSKDG